MNNEIKMDKSQIRDILPPTTRNFETRIGAIEEKIAWLYDHVAAIEEKQACYNAKAASLAEYNLFASLETLRNSYCKTPRTRILLAGWYGAENYGDELMMHTILNYLPKDIIENTTVLLWNNDEYPLTKLDSRVNVLHYPPTVEGIRTLSELFDVLIWGGGAILDDTQFDFCAANYSTGNLFIHLSKQMLALDKKVFCVSLSSNNSIKNKCYKKELQSVIDNSSYFSVRDPYSLNTLSDAGINVSNVRLDGDIVFANKELRKLSERTNAPKLNSSNRTIGLVLHCFDELEGFNYQLLNDVASLEAPSNESNCTILLIPFYNEHKHDGWHLEQLACRFTNSQPDHLTIHVASYEDDLARTPLLDCDFVLSCRYHASLIAGCLHIPFVAICNDKHSHYPNKTKYLLEQFFPKHNWNDSLLSVSNYSKNKLEESMKQAQEHIVDNQILENLFRTESESLKAIFELTK